MPTVTALADGNFIVTWTSADGATDDIKSQVFDPRVYAGDGSNETVYGGNDDDQLDGGAGADVLYGGDGDDVFETVTPDDLADDDVFDGGAGIDTLDLDEYVLSWGGPAVLLGDNGTVTSVEVINLHGPTAGTGSNLIDIAIPLANSAEDGLLTVNGAQGQDVIRGDRVSNASVPAAPERRRWRRSSLRRRGSRRTRRRRPAPTGSMAAKETTASKLSHETTSTTAMSSTAAVASIQSISTTRS